MIVGNDRWNVSAIASMYRELIPLPQDREPLTWHTAPIAFGYTIPFVYMAYLVRRRDTHMIRLLLLPVIIIMTLKGTFGYGGSDPDFIVANWLRGCGGLFVIATSMDYACAKRGRFKLDETTLPAIGESMPSPGAKGLSKDVQVSKRPVAWVPFPAWFSDAVELLLTARGIGWDFGRGVFVPREWRPLSRGPFLRATFISLVQNYLAMDFCEAVLKLLRVGHPGGASMFYRDFPLAQRYAISTSVQLVFGLSAISGLNVMYIMSTLIGVGLRNQSPTQWPPLMNNPWGADSLHDFWAKRWHQLMRRTYLVCGGIPAGRLAGKYGYVLGTFLASGLYHEFGAYCMGKGLDHRVTWFFILQGVGVSLEKLFARATGHRVSGWSGRIWTYLFVVGLGQMCVDSWLARGVAGSMSIPEAISPSRRIFLPVALSMMQYVAR